MDRLNIRTCVLILLSIGGHPGLVLSSEPIIKAFSDKTRLVVNVTSPDSTRSECFVYSDGGDVLRIDYANVTRLSSPKIEELIKTCHKGNPNTRTRRINKRAIYPGTKWCGAGNISKNFDDLGVHREVDKCCRKHDHCPDFIKPFTFKHGLFNPSLVTKSHCKCDRGFKKCLTEGANAHSLTSIFVYHLFFNLLRMNCFEQVTAKDCVEWKYDKCLKYENVTKWAMSSS